MKENLQKEEMRKIVKQWQNDGVVFLQNVIDDAWLKILAEGVERAMREPSPMARDYTGKNGGRFFTDHHMCKRIENFQRFQEESGIIQLAASIMDSLKINYVDEHLLVKEPGTENKTHWHQDLPYYEISGTDFGSFWIPLDQVDESSGAMRFVRGSHQSEKIYQPVRIAEGVLVEDAEKYCGPAPDIDQKPELYDLLSFAMKPGDVLFFHAGLLHAAYPNKTHDRRRRALSLRYAGDNAFWQPRKYVPSGGNGARLEVGGPLDSEEYPVVWKARPY